MRIINEHNGMGPVLNGLMGQKTVSQLVVTTVTGEKLEAYEPVTMGPDFIMFKSSKSEAASSVLVRWSAIAKVVVV